MSRRRCVLLAAIDLYGTAGQSGELSVWFESKDTAVCEFHTFWNGAAAPRIESITLVQA
jgi:hypothetical protein